LYQLQKIVFWQQAVGTLDLANIVVSTKRSDQQNYLTEKKFTKNDLRHISQTSRRLCAEVQYVESRNAEKIADVPSCGWVLPTGISNSQQKLCYIRFVYIWTQILQLLNYIASLVAHRLEQFLK
jgi:hypothetical protein